MPPPGEDEQGHRDDQPYQHPQHDGLVDPRAGGGLPGRKLRSGTMANSIAAYQVPNGGKNDVLPNAIGMATHNAKHGQGDQDQADSEVEDQRSLGPVQRDDHVVEDIRVAVSSGSWTRVTLTSQPSNDPVTSTRAAMHFRGSPTGEDIGRDLIGFVGVERPVAGIAVCLDGGG